MTENIPGALEYSSDLGHRTFRVIGNIVTLPMISPVDRIQTFQGTDMGELPLLGRAW